MQKVTGIGGVFVRAKDPNALSKWYEDTPALISKTKLGCSSEGRLFLRPSKSTLTTLGEPIKSG
jgi:hypothetical protein